MKPLWNSFVESLLSFYRWRSTACLQKCMAKEKSHNLRDYNESKLWLYRSKLWGARAKYVERWKK